MENFELIPHTADLKIKVFGKNKQELFRNALIAMFKIIKPEYIEGEEKKFDVMVDSPDIEALLVDFLSEALYLPDANSIAFKDAQIHEFTDKSIVATIIGFPIKSFEVVEIKAVTYHDLSIKEVNGVWQTEIVFDI